MQNKITRVNANKLMLTVILPFILFGVGLSNRDGRVSVSQPTSPPGEKITPTVRPSSDTWHIEWRIDEPNIQQQVTEYRQIWFQAGDRVSVRAGGCAQTGGHGNTWKRYVDPSGPNADHLYHGLIWIPGVIGGPETGGGRPDLKRIAGYVNHTSLATGATFLRLGYEDDDYGDNGYWGHDDGTGDQCKGVGNAFVIITIERALPKGSKVTSAEGAETVSGYQFSNPFQQRPDSGFMVAAVGQIGGLGPGTGVYGCICAKADGSCTTSVFGSYSSFSCRPGPARATQAPGIPYCTAECVAVPSRRQ